MTLLVNHYEVLGVSPTASFDELKTAFRSAALRHHPDKSGNDAEFLKVQHAWHILSNSESRAVYDLQRAAAEARAAVHITDTILIEDMESGTTEDGEAMVSWPCRCGGAYAVLEEELFKVHENPQSHNHQHCGNQKDENDGGGAENNNKSEIIVPCSTCSLHILVLLNKDNAPSSS